MHLLSATYYQHHINMQPSSGAAKPQQQFTEIKFSLRWKEQSLNFITLDEREMQFELLSSPISIFSSETNQAEMKKRVMKAKYNYNYM